MKILWMMAASVLLAGCVTGYNPTRSFNYVQIANLSGGEIRDLSSTVVGAE